jgi:acyl-coenzyme A thioesterase PaaI-like protein
LTSEARVIDVPGVPRLEVVPHHCFACGSLNVHGIGLILHVEPDRAWTETSLGARFQGWDEIAHGGIVATILDEVMAWSLAAADDWGVTARMAIEYRKPVPLDTMIRADGWITRKRRRIIDTEARIIDRATEAVLATASGVYVAADEERKAQLRARCGFPAVATPGAVDLP